MGWYRLRTRNHLYLSCNHKKDLSVQRPSQSSCHFFRWDGPSLICFAGGKNYRVVTSENKPKERHQVIAWDHGSSGGQGKAWNLESVEEVVKVNITEHTIKNGYGFQLTAMDGYNHFCKPGNILRQVGGYGMDGQHWTLEDVERKVNQ